MDNHEAHQLITRAKQALQRGDRINARRLASVAARLDPTDEKPWLILAAAASPQACLVYLEKALALNPSNEFAQKGLIWAKERVSSENAGSENAGGKAQRESLPVEDIAQMDKFRKNPNAGAFRINSLQKINALISSWAGSTTFARVAKYTLVRGISLFITIVASLFLIIYIANLGGYLDTIQMGLISENINGMLSAGWLKGTSEPERQQTIDQTRTAMEAFYGLDQPYVSRVVNWLKRGITFDWGKSRFKYIITSTYVNGTHTQDVTTDDIRTEILSYLPRTLLLLGLSNLGLFIISIPVSLILNRNPGNWIARAMTALAPVSAAPSWMFGLVLIIIFHRFLRNYTIGLGMSTWMTNFDWKTILALIKAIFLPFLAIFLSKFFQSVYSWRAYFLAFSNENYIELAKAKGLSPGMMERRYLLRPALPSIITSFALIMISIWQECIAVEYFFNVGGIGSFFVQALDNNEIGVIVALVATFAYFLAITVFILDIAYALIDPRVKIQTDIQNSRSYRQGSGIKNFRLVFQKMPLRVISFLYPKKKDPNRAEKDSLANRIWLNGQQVALTARSLLGFLKELLHFPSAVIGTTIVVILIIISIGTIIAIPYDRAIRLWRGDDLAWIRNPIEVLPAWTNLFRQEKLPENILINSQVDPPSRVSKSFSHGGTGVTLNYQFDYPYNLPPQDILLFFHTRYNVKQPFVTLTWIAPDGKETLLKNTAVARDTIELFSTDNDLVRRLKGVFPATALFSGSSSPAQVVKGKYGLRIDGLQFETGNDLDAELVVYGKVYGLAGTDNQRRDLMLVLLWGTFAAITFGILAAIGTTFSSVTLAAAGAWFGGWVDGLIQRISEINLVLPVLPTSILIFFLYSKSFWVILGVTIGLSIFGSSIKNYRAMFIQIKELPYIEAASSYGASDWRIIFQYLIPRVRSTLIPQLVVLVPSYIFFESTLSFLGVSDPFLPTLGKLLVTTLKGGLAGSPLYLLMEPVGMLVLIALGFAMIGFALERLFNEKLGV